jgi:hypothetical protein
LSIQEFGYKDQLHRALTTKDLVIYGLIFMVPIAPYSVFGFYVVLTVWMKKPVALKI